MRVASSHGCTRVQVWLLEIVRDELVVKASKPNPIFKNLNDEVQKVGGSVKRLFTYQYQVLPFVYTHLVSLCSVVYLMFHAFLKGLHFEPDAGCAGRPHHTTHPMIGSQRALGAHTCTPLKRRGIVRARAAATRSGCCCLSSRCC